MTEELFFDGARYISAADAAKNSKLTRDYIARLAREGRILGKVIGRQWYVSTSSLNKFLVSQEQSNEERRSALVLERLQEYGRSQELDAKTSQAVPLQSILDVAPAAAQNGIHRILAEAVLRTGEEASSKRPSVSAHLSQRLQVSPLLPNVGFINKIIAGTLALALIVGLYSSQGSLGSFFPQMTGSFAPTGEVASAADAVSGTFSAIEQAIAQGTNALFSPFVGMYLAKSGQQGGVTLEIKQIPAPTKINQKPLAVAQPPAPTQVVEKIVENPIIQKLVETQPIAVSGGITQSELDQRLQQLDNALSEKIALASSANATTIAQNYNVTAQTNAIDQLNGTTIKNPSISGGSISNTSISGSTISGATFSGLTTLEKLAVSGTATSTYAGGITLTSGCVSVNGTCLGSGLASNPAGSDTQVQFNSQGAFAGSSFFTFSTSTATLSVSNASTTNATTTNATTTNLFVSGKLSLGSALPIASGGTGTTTAPVYGQLLVGNGSGGYSLLATSSLGIVGGSGSSNVSTSSQNTWSALQIFAGNASSSNFSNFGTAFFGGTATSSFNSMGQLTLANLSNAILGVSASGQVVATSSFGTNLLTGNLGTINGLALAAGGSITVTAASSTLLANNNLFSGRDTFSLINLSATSSGLLATDANGNVIATTTIGTNLLSANTISGVALGSTLANLSAGSGLSGSAYNGSATQAFSLNLANANNWTGLQTFQNASSTNFSTFANAYFGGSATSSFNSSGQLTLANLTNAVLGVNSSGQVVATSSIGTNLLTGNLGTVNGQNLTAGGSITVTAASSTLLSNNNTFSGNNLFSASTTFSNLININQSSTSLATLGTTWLTGLSNALLSVDNNGKIIASSTIGTNLLTANTISGVALGGNLFNLSATDGTLTFSGTYNGSTARTAGLNLGNANSWTALQQFNAAASTTQISVINKAFFGGSATTTIDSAGNVAVAGTLNVTGQTTLAQASSTAISVFNKAYFGGTATSSFSSNGALTLGSVLSCTGNQALQTDGSGNVSCGAITVSGASSGGGWTTNNTGRVSLSTTTDLVVVGATTTPYAKFTVISGSTATTTLAIVPASGQTANIFDIYNTSGALGSVFTAGGNLGLGTTSPAARLAVSGTAYITATTTLGATTTVTGPLSLGTATTTASNGFNITAGCFSVNGTCVGSTSASSTLLSDNNTFTGNNLFTASTTFSNLININQSSTSLATFGSLYFSNLANAILSTNANGQVVSTSSIGVNYLTGTLGVVNGGTGSTTLTGILKGNGTGAIQSAVAGTDYQAPITASYPIQFSANNLSLAFGTTTANTWSALQTFNGGASTTNISASGEGYFATASTTNLIISGAPSGILQTNSSGTVSAGSVALGSQVSGILPVGNGGTGWANIAANTLLTGNGAGSLATTSVGAGLSLSGGSLSNSGVTSVNQTYGTNQTGAITLATSSSVSFNGLTLSHTITNSGGTFTFANTLNGTLNNSGLTNSTISGVALGGNLFNLSHDATLSGSSYNGSAAVSNWGLNLANANTWTSLQTFANASTTLFSAYGPAYFGGTATSSFGTNGALTLATALTVPNGGTGQSSFSSSQLLYGAGSGALQSVATSTLSFSGPFTTSGTLGSLVGGTNFTLTLPQANGSTNGYLASADWTTFNNKVSSTSLSATYPLAYTPSTGAFTLAFGTTTANTWSQLQTFNAGFNSIASSTIGNGTQAGGLTISGGATTTGNSLVSGTQTVGNLINSGLTANALIYANASEQETSGSVASSLSFSAGTLSLNTGNANYFTALQNFTNASTSQFTATSSVYFTGVSASSVLALNASNQVIATTSIGANLLTGSLGTINGATFNAGGSVTVASTTLLSDNNTFSGSNTFSSLLKLTGGLLATASSTIGNGTQVGGLTISGGATTTGTATFNNGLVVSGATSTFSNGITLSSGCVFYSGSCIGANSGTVSSGTQGQFAFYNTNGTTISATSSLFVTQAGQIGIGTTSPGIIAGATRYLTIDSEVSSGLSALELSGNSNASGAAIGRISFYNGIAFGGELARVSAVTVNNTDKGALVFSTANLAAPTEAARFDPSGNFGIGTTTPGSIFSVQGVGNFVASATSTLYNGLNLASGCFSIGGTCLATGVSSVSNSDGTLTISPTSGAVVASLALAHANTWTGLQQFTNASTTLFSAYGPAYFGATATSSFNSVGQLTLAGITSALLKTNGSNQIVAAVAGTDYQVPITATYPIQFSANNLSLAFGTTTVNTWSALQTFNGGASTTNITASGEGYFATASTTNLIVSGSPSGILQTNSSGTVSAGQVALGSQVSGILPVTNGGTGWGNISANTLLTGNGTGALATTSIGTGLSLSGGTLSNAGVTSVNQTYGTTQTGALILATSSAVSFNGLTLSHTITNAGGTFTFANALTGTLNNSGLTNSTIGLTNGGGLTVSGSPIALGGSGSVALDLTHANNWTGLQQFTNASTTLFSAYGPAYFGATATSSFSSTGALTLANALTYGGVTLNNAVTGTGNLVLSASPTLTGTLTAAAANFSGATSFTGLSSFNNASTSLLSVFSKAYFGGTATSTFDSAGNLSLVSNGLTVGTNQLIVSAGNVGIGTTTPWAKLSIHANNGDTNTTLFAIASSTASATTTLFSISNTGTITQNAIKNSLIAADNNGNLIASTTIGINLLTGTLATINGTGITAGGSATITAASSTLLANNNTFSGNDIFSNLLVLNGGLTAYASSTIGNGSNGGGLTISGGATTTGNAYFANQSTFLGAATFYGAISAAAITATNTVTVNVSTPATQSSGNGTTLNNSFLVQNGNGGNTSANTGTVVGGGGGSIKLTAGTGGLITGNPTNGFAGNGGDLTLSAGAGGFVSGIPTGTSDGGNGGNVTISGGGGGTGNTANGAGGNATLRGGASNGAGNTSGNVYVIGGAGNGGATAGNVFLGADSSGNIWGNIGIASTSPFANLSVQAASTSVNSTILAVGSTTSAGVNSTLFSVSNIGLTTLLNLSATGATTSAFAISGISSGNLLKTTTGGAIVAAVAGTDYATPANISAAFPFTSTTFGSTAANATSTLIGFTNGLYALASSTIGNGTQAGGLTISGGATTTGALAIQQSGTAASPAIRLGGSATGFYSPSASTLGISANGSLIGDYGISNGSTWTLGNASLQGTVSWFGTSVTGNNGDVLRVSSTNNGTLAQSIINTSSGSSASSNLYFGNNTSASEGSLILNSSGNASGNGANSFTISGAAGLWLQAGVTNQLMLNTSGNVGIGTSTPWAKLSLHANNGETNTTLFAIASSTANATTTLFSISNTGVINLNPAAQTGDKLALLNSQNFFSATTSSNGFLALGYQAGQSLLATSTAAGNTVFGYQALMTATSSLYNTAIGFQVLKNANDYAAQLNTGLGYIALSNNTIGQYNTALGAEALLNNTTGSSNAAIGTWAMQNNTTGHDDVGLGQSALAGNITGLYNSAVGSNALTNNASATNTVAVGTNSGKGTATYSNQGGTYVGAFAGQGLQTGSDYNILLGFQSGYNLTTGSNNLILASATSSNAIANLTTGSQNILIGNNVSLPSATANGQLNIGNILYGTAITGTGSTISSGSIGIGTTTPWAKLSVTGPDTTTGYAFVAANSGNSPVFSIQDNGIFTYSKNSTSTILNNTAYAWTIATSSTASPLFKIDSTTGSETVSIGAAGSDIYIGDTGASPNLVFQNSGQTIKTASGGTINIGAGTDAITFGGSGQLLAGTTTAGSSIGKLVITSGTTPQLALGDGTAGDNLWTFRNTGGQLFLATSTYSATSSVSAFQLDTNGDLIIRGAATTCTIGNGTAATNCSSSDQRLKTNITTLTATSGLASLMRLNPVSFNWSQWMQSIGNGSTTQFGLIAQQVQNVFPNLVHQDDRTGYYTLDYQGLEGPLLLGEQQLNGVFSATQATTSAPTILSLFQGTTTPITIDQFGDLGIGTSTATTTTNLQLCLNGSCITSFPYATSAISSTSIPQFAPNFLDALKQAIVGYLADAANGIHDIYANIFHAQEVDTQTLCVTDSTGAKTCLTKAQLDALIAGAAGSASTSTATTSTTTAPILQINGNNPATVNVGTTYSDLGATITGPTPDLNLGIKASVDGATSTPISDIHIDTSKAGTHAITYSATDQNGVMGSAVRTLVVVDSNAKNTATSTSSTSSTATSTTTATSSQGTSTSTSAATSSPSTTTTSASSSTTSTSTSTSTSTPTTSSTSTSTPTMSTSSKPIM